MSRAYFEADAVNWSTLKLLRESPMAYRHALTHKRADTADLAVGRLVHTRHSNATTQCGKAGAAPARSGRRS